MEPTLLDHLARFSSFTRQSELLCTQGLTYVLQNYDAARTAIAEAIKVETDVECAKNLEWLAEPVQADGSRPDLEARKSDNVPAIKIEAKLRAELGFGQLDSYVQDLLAKNSDISFLIVLVPDWRIDEINDNVSQTFNQTVAPPFSVSVQAGGAPPSVTVFVISWNDLFDSLERIDSNPRYLLELEQLRAMYLALSGDHLTALASEEIQKQWKANLSGYYQLVDLLTRRLSKGERTLPFREEPIAEITQDDSPSSVYRLRYICPFSHLKNTCFSIGIREPFINYSTPIWMRFHRKTPNYETVQSKIKLSDIDWLESNGHLWIPLEELLDDSSNNRLDYLYYKVESIMTVVDSLPD